MSSNIERQQARTMGKWFFLWAFASMLLTTVFFCLGKLQTNHHHLMNPWIAYGFAIAFIWATMFCLVLAALNHAKANS